MQHMIVQPHPLCSPRAGHGEGTSALGEGLHFCENKKTARKSVGISMYSMKPGNPLENF